jgi:hypothetical protein
MTKRRTGFPQLSYDCQRCHSVLQGAEISLKRKEFPGKSVEPQEFSRIASLLPLDQHIGARFFGSTQDFACRCSRAHAGKTAQVRVPWGSQAFSLCCRRTCELPRVDEADSNSDRQTGLGAICLTAKTRMIATATPPIIMRLEKGSKCQ